MIDITTFTNGKKVACPASAEFLDPLAGYKLHFASKAELEKHGGVCKQCAEKFKKRGAAILAGKIETPGAMVPPPPQMPDDHVAWQNVSGENYAELIQTSDFNFDEIDAALGLFETAAPEVRAQAGEVLREIFQFCFGTRRKKLGANELKSAAMRFAVVVSGLRPDILNDATHGELARHLSRTKAAASKASCAFEDRHGIQFARSRRSDARAAMRKARLAQHGVNRNKPKAKGDTGQGANQLGPSNCLVTCEPAEAGGQAEGAA